jgi:hypothetical protein
MRLSLSSSLRPRLAVPVTLALALGAAFVGVGCGPQKPFCADAADNNYVCVPPSDATVQQPDGNDGPPEDRGPLVVGDDEDAGATD